MNILWLFCLLITTLLMGVGQNYLFLSSEYEKLSDSANQERAKKLERIGDRLWYLGCGFCLMAVFVTKMEWWHFIVLIIAGFYYTPFFKDWAAKIYWRAIIRAVPSTLLLMFIYFGQWRLLWIALGLMVIDQICIFFSKD